MYTNRGVSRSSYFILRSQFFKDRRKCNLSKIGSMAKIHKHNWARTSNSNLNTQDLNLRDHEKNGSRGQLTIPDFTNYKAAFKNKTMQELGKAYFIFRLCSIDTLVNNQLKILQRMRKLLGKPLFTFVMKKTLYGHFLAGESAQEVKKRVLKHTASGIIPMLAYTAAEEHGHTDLQSSANSKLSLFEKNKSAVMESVMMAGEMKYFKTDPKCSSKLTFFKPMEVLKNSSELILFNKELIEKHRHLVNSEDNEFMAMVQECIERCKIVSTIESALMHFPFHLNLRDEIVKNFQIYKEPIKSKTFKDSEIHDLMASMETIGQKAEELDVSIFWDAEQTYINPIIQVLIIDNMRLFNRNRATIYGTYQCYLKATYNHVVSDLNIAADEGFKWGGKIVRGAYIEEERRLARELNYEDPVNESYKATTEMYYKVAEYILHQYEKHRALEVTFATHNEETVQFLIHRINELNINPDKHIMFAQLLGMRDHISYSLGNVGVPVAKLAHYGPVEDCIAYLSRRVMENRGAIATADQERKLHGKEIKRRMLRK